MRQVARSNRYVNQRTNEDEDSDSASENGIYDERKSHRPDKRARPVPAKPTGVSKRSARTLNSQAFLNAMRKSKGIKPKNGFGDDLNFGLAVYSNISFSDIS